MVDSETLLQHQSFFVTDQSRLTRVLHTAAWQNDVNLCVLYTGSVLLTSFRNRLCPLMIKLFGLDLKCSSPEVRAPDAPPLNYLF
jgi:hypothetical protein